MLHWIHYLPHYKTLPEPPSMDKDDHLLRRRDTMKESALQIASYATKPDRKVCGSDFLGLPAYPMDVWRLSQMGGGAKFSGRCNTDSAIGLSAL